MPGTPEVEFKLVTGTEETLAGKLQTAAEMDDWRPILMSAATDSSGFTIFVLLQRERIRT